MEVSSMIAPASTLQILLEILWPTNYVDRKILSSVLLSRIVGHNWVFEYKNYCGAAYIVNCCMGNTARLKRLVLPLPIYMSELQSVDDL
jgi:hypothetical protein